MNDWVSDSSRVITGTKGQIAHRVAFEQAARLEPRVEVVRPGVWCVIGNGLSNQTFIEGPEGIIAIDTGECVEEMTAALDILAAHTSRPVVAVIYSHFHYVAGTRAVFDRFGEVPVFGHERIPLNRARAANEIGPAYSRGLVQQFATTLPLDGPDGNVSVGLGLHYRNPNHRPFTNGFVPPGHTWRGGESTVIAGLRVDVEHAPSDADDSVTLWFPDLATCVQNNVWPVVFNVYAIRGEEYRNPQVMLPGIDHVLGLEPEHLVCAHGPSMSGRDEIRRRVTRYRDLIQLMWDQTVRHMNLGRTMDEIAHLVRLPPGSEVGSTTTRVDCSAFLRSTAPNACWTDSAGPTRCVAGWPTPWPPRIFAGRSRWRRGSGGRRRAPTAIVDCWPESCAPSASARRRPTSAVGASPGLATSRAPRTSTDCARTDCASSRWRPCRPSTRCDCCGCSSIPTARSASTDA